MKINNVVEKQFINNLKIDTSKDYKVFYEEGKNLLVNSRMDVIPKLCYLESYISNYQTSFFEELYKSSIEVFSNGNFKEPGNQVKNSFDKYKDVFIELYKNIVENGFDEQKSIFIKGTNNAILDGGHRAAIAYYKNIKIPYVMIDNVKVNYDLKYFEDRYMDKKKLDYICLDYAKRKDNIYVICLWQTLNNKQKDEAINYIKEKMNIIYKKNIKFNYNGLKNFMVEIYGHQNWMGSYKNHYQGVYKKVDSCFKKDNVLTCVVVETTSVEKVLEIKKDLREKFKIGNHSIHSTDNKIETEEMLSILLNDNSIDILNKFNFDKYISCYEDINQIIRREENNLDNKIIYGDILLKMAGVRELSSYKIFEHKANNNKYDELIFNPSNYFYFHGLKFLTLMEYKKMEDFKGNDLKLVNDIIKDRKIDFSEYCLKIKRYGRKIRGIFIDILKKLKIEGIVRKVYLKIKGKHE